MIEENPTILKIDFILKSGYVLSAYSYARGFDVTFSGGQCSDYSLEIPEGFPAAYIVCAEIAAVIVNATSVDEYGNEF